MKEFAVTAHWRFRAENAKDAAARAMEWAKDPHCPLRLAIGTNDGTPPVLLFCMSDTDIYLRETIEGLVMYGEEFQDDEAPE